MLLQASGLRVCGAHACCREQSLQCLSSWRCVSCHSHLVQIENRLQLQRALHYSVTHADDEGLPLDQETRELLHDMMQRSSRERCVRAIQRERVLERKHACAQGFANQW